ncbi:acyltransferase [Faecalicatena orotica]|uniref:acyltransferase n=1 Tax=Faecalicatena orotica TaxID=1544 RepID=UPI0032166E72
MSIDKKSTTINIEYLDALRVLALFAMMLLHISSSYMKFSSLGSITWVIALMFNSSVRWCVPIFIMISGCLFLRKEKEVSVSIMLKKYVLHILKVFSIWSAIYAIGNFIVSGQSFNYSSFKELVITWVRGHYHLWFLYVIAGLYIIVPILKLITANRKICSYLLVIGIIFSSILPTVLNVIQGGVFVEEGMAGLNILFGKNGGFLVYFLMGFQVHSTQFKKNIRLGLYSLGVLGLVATFERTYHLSMTSGTLIQDFLSYPFLNCLLISCAIYVFVRQFVEKKGIGLKSKKILRKLSINSFGMYLIHALVIAILEKGGWMLINIPSIIMIIITTAIVFIISFVIIEIMNKIHFVHSLLL